MEATSREARSRRANCGCLCSLLDCGGYDGLDLREAVLNVVLHQVAGLLSVTVGDGLNKTPVASGGSARHAGRWRHRGAPRGRARVGNRLPARDKALRRAPRCRVLAPGSPPGRPAMAVPFLRRRHVWPRNRWCTPCKALRRRAERAGAPGGLPAGLESAGLVTPTSPVRSWAA